MAPSVALVVTGVVVLVLVVLGGWALRRAVRRRYEGWYARDGAAPGPTDARGAVNRHSWMLGGGGGGGGG